MLAANGPSDLETAVNLANEFKLKFVLNHISHSQPVLDYVASLKVPVIVGPIYEAPKEDERYDAVYSLPAQLYKRGVKIVFASYAAHNARNLPDQAGYATAFGLPYDEALKAITHQSGGSLGRGRQTRLARYGEDSQRSGGERRSVGCEDRRQASFHRGARSAHDQPASLAAGSVLEVRSIIRKIRKGGSMSLSKRATAEFFGTFWLVFGGCGSAVLAAAFPQLGIGFVGVALAFGLTVLTMAFAIGHISGCHLNPAVSVGLVVGKRFPAGELLPYVIAQVLGGMAGAGVLCVIASGKAGFDVSGGFASNGYGAHSPGGYSLTACLVAEVVLTFFFLMIIMGSTDRRAPAGFAPIAIGLGLTLIHLIGIPVTNLSVNPARSTGPAVFVGGWAIAQLWLFWVAPVLGGAIAGGLYHAIFED